MRVVINQLPWLSPILYVEYANVVDFKGDFHNLFIGVNKDSMGTWHKFPHLVAEDDIMGVINKWISHSITPSDRGSERHKFVKGEARKTTVVMTRAKEKKKEEHKPFEKEKATTKEKVAQQKDSSAKEREAPKEKVSTKETKALKDKTTTTS